MSLIAKGKFPDLFCGNSLANRLYCRTYPRGNERAETGKSQTFAVFCYLAVETRSRQTASTANKINKLRRRFGLSPLNSYHIATTQMRERVGHCRGLVAADGRRLRAGITEP